MPDSYPIVRKNCIGYCAKTTFEDALNRHQRICGRWYASVGRYLERMVDPWIAEILASAPAVMITGARASGKTTTALRHAASVVRLDNEREAFPFEADPDSALRNLPEPVLLDEWQACPVPARRAHRRNTDLRPLGLGN